MQRQNEPNIWNVWLFFLLTFAITWLILIPKALITQPTTKPPLFNISLVGTWGPTLAAIIMIYRERGKAGLRKFFDRIIKWRIGIQWYLALVGVPLFIHLSTIGLHVLRGGSFPDPFSQVSLSMTLPVFLLIMVIGGGNEEPGWRGYAQPKLQTKYNATVSSLTLGVVWGFWHLPLFFIPGSSQEGVFFPGFLLLILGRTFIFTWFYNNTKSVFGCIVLHAWFNLSTAYFLMPNTTDPIFVLLSLIVLWVAVIVLIAVFGTKKLSRKPEALEAGLQNIIRTNRIT